MNSRHALPEAADRDALRSLRWLVWIYFLLLIVEGALRKWVLPEWSTPLLLVRDPVVLAIYALALVRGVFPVNGWVLAMAAIAVPTTALSLAFSGLPLTVTAFGFRANFLHFPLIFVVARVFDFEDVKRIGWCLVALAVPMAVLVHLQFGAPPDAWINRTPGGGEAMMSSLLTARASGTFSFYSGLVSFVGLLTAVLVAAIYRRELLRWWALAAGAGALGVILVFCAGRAVLLAALMVLAAGAAMSLLRPRLIPAFVIAGLLAGAGWFLVDDLPAVQQGLTVHVARFTEASAVEVSTLARVLAAFVPPFHLLWEGPTLGQGIGLGTNAGSIYLHGQALFLLGEGEFGRAVFEMGALPGFAYMGLRWGLALWIGWMALGCLRRGNPLPLLLLAGSYHGLMMGQWGIATSLGFGVIGPGLALAAMREREETVEAEEPAPEIEEPVPAEAAPP